MNTNPFYHEAIRNLYTDVSRTNDTHGALDSKGNKIVLDDAKLAVEMDRLKKEFDAQLRKMDGQSKHQYKDTRDRWSYAHNKVTKLFSKKAKK